MNQLAQIQKKQNQEVIDLDSVYQENQFKLQNFWLDQIFSLRYKVYSQIGVINPTSFPDGKVEDEFDKLQSTLHFIVVDECRVVAASRLVGLSEVGLSIEKEFPISFYLEKLGKNLLECLPIIDGSRLIVDPKNQNNNIGTFLYYSVPKYAFDVLGAKYFFTVGNPDYKGTFLVGCKQLGDSIPYKIPGSSGQENHRAAAIYLTKEMLIKPRGLISHKDKCYIIQPSRQLEEI